MNLIAEVYGLENFADKEILYENTCVSFKAKVLK